MGSVGGFLVVEMGCLWCIGEETGQIEREIEYCFVTENLTLEGGLGLDMLNCGVGM